MAENKVIQIDFRASRSTRARIVDEDQCSAGESDTRCGAAVTVLAVASGTSASPDRGSDNWRPERIGNDGADEAARETLSGGVGKMVESFRFLGEESAKLQDSADRLRTQSQRLAGALRDLTAGLQQFNAWIEQQRVAHGSRAGHDEDGVSTR